MKWSEYNQRMDSIHAPDSLKEKLYAMQTDADPLDAPRLAPKKPALRLHVGKGHGLQIAAALVCCVGLAGMVLPGFLGSIQRINGVTMDFGVPNGEAAMQSIESDVLPQANNVLTDSAASADGGAALLMDRSVSARKIVYTTDLWLESTDYDDTLTQLEAAVAETGGYVQQCDSYTRAGSLRNLDATYRIPAANYPAFLDKAAVCGNLIRTNEQTDDITSQFIDTQARVESLQAQRDHLLQLQEKTEALSDLLAITEQLTEVQYQLESWQQQLNFFADQVDYCTINISLEEVSLYTPTETTLWARITQAVTEALTNFGDSLADGMIWLLARWPWLLVLGGGLAWTRHICKKKKQAR